MSQDRHLDRRSLLAAGAGALAFTLAAPALAAQAQQEGHQHGSPGAKIDPPKNTDLVRSSNDCVRTGYVCINHCYQTFQTGDTSLAECVRRVQELVAGCEALARLASLDAKYLNEFAAVTAKVCRRCEEECRKHAHHMPCKDCAEACAACAKECDKLKA